MSRKNSVFIVAILVSVAFTGYAAAAEQFRWVVQTNTHASALADGSASNPPDDGASVTAGARGGEQSQCNAGEQRTSNGSSSAQARKDVETIISVGVTLTAAAHANGGHFVRCGTCLGGTCIGRLPEDTTATAAARASASVNIVFDPDARPIWYILAVSRDVRGSASDTTFHISDGNRELAAAAGKPLVIEGGPGKSYQVTATIAQNVRNEGACCQDDKSGENTFLLTLTRAPIIASQREFLNVETASHGRILGGRPETGFPLVGALFLNGAVHCSGTVIGPSTVLTAAHCVYQQEPTSLKWVEGYNSQLATAAYEVTDIEYPKEADGSYLYDDKNLTDDIAVIHLKDSPHKNGMRRYAGIPKIEKVLENKTLITFMGYGFQRVEGELTDAGIKRRVEIPLFSVSPRTFEYRSPDKNTCYGDSGGPAFVTGDSKIWVIGVTSKGDLRCEINGIDTRVDAFEPWLRLRIR